ncbi:MAG: DMT family transporter [Planctomycetota bacterium]|nr:DMT family transporter [Planctomycetota bacterium]MDG2142722.1 DMT family transporter [Planctomycetota bacterium]
MSDHEVQKRRALTALLGVTVVWGWTFVWMKQALDLVTLTLGPEGEDAAIGMFLTIRFGLAALLLPLFLPSCRRRENWSMGLVVSGGSLGALLLTGFLLQMTALTTVSPAVSAFLTSLYVIFTAFLSLFFAQHRSISKALFAGVLLATLGAAFINGPPQLGFSLAEWLTVICAFIFAGTILLTDLATRKYAPAAVSLASFAVVATGGLVYTIWCMTQPSAPEPSQLLGLLGMYDYWWPLACCSILATLVALSTLNHFQRTLPPVRAATLYALEPVWGAIISILYGMEAVDGWFALGATLLLAGNLIAEFMPNKPTPAPPPE